MADLINSQPTTEQDSSNVVISSGSPNIENNLNNDSQTKRSPAIVILIIAIIVSFLLMVSSGVLLWMSNNNQPKVLTTTNKTLPSKEVITTEILKNRAHPVAFLRSSGPANTTPIDEVVLYDIDNKQELPPIPEFKFNGGVVIVGNWSPDGRYLPVVFDPIDKSGDNSKPASLFLYDLSNKTVKKILEANREDHNFWVSSLPIFFLWIDNNKILLSRDLLDDRYSDYYYVTVGGQTGKERHLHKEIIKNKSFTAIYENVNGVSGVSEIIINGNKLPIKPKGQVVGFYNSTLVSLDSPQISPMTDSTGKMNPVYATLSASLSKLSKSEQEKITQDLFDPKGDYFIYLFNIDTNAETKLTLDGSVWKSISAQISPKEPVIIVQQVDSNILPKLQRFISLNLSDSNKQEEIVQQNIISPGATSYESIADANKFNLSDDGKWILIYSPDDQFASSDRSITAINVMDKTQTKICKQYCRDLRVYNPMQPVFGFYLE